VVPDLQVAIAGRTVVVELFHRWHGHALRRRLDQLAEGWAPNLVLGVDRTVLRGDASIAAHPSFIARGFAFTELPAARALGEVITRIAGH
jgi:uncharacterized protein